MERCEAFLHVGAGAHLAGRPDQHSDLSVKATREQLRLLLVVSSVVDKRDLRIGHAVVNNHGA